jgi:peptide/nickel transport system ATP-binding protein
VLAVVGESGSGKSVTALTIMGLLVRSARATGSIVFDGREILGLREKEMRTIRGKDIAMIFQDPMTALNPVFTIGDQIAEAIRVHNPSMSKRAAIDRAAELLNLVGVPEPKRRVKQYPHEFSGGMRQRAMIAMAIANDPKMLIADEPTTALDVTIQAQVLEVMKMAQDATGAAMLLITHDLGVVAGIADRVQVMYAGRLFETGSADDIFYRSRNPYTLGLLQSVPRINARTEDRLRTIPGSPPSLLHPPAGCPFRPRCPYAIDICRQSVPELYPVETEQHCSRCHRASELPELVAALVASEEAAS